MKLLSAQQISEIDALSCKALQIESIDLMENAAEQLCNWFVSHTSANGAICIFCGPGNNGGDGLALGRKLYENGRRVSIIKVCEGDKFSENFLINEKRIKEIKDITYLNFDVFNNKELTSEDILVDAIFGNGIRHSPEGVYKQAVDTLNSLNQLTIAIDIPSGLFPEAQKNNRESLQSCVKADVTLAIEQYRVSFLYPESGRYCGELHLLKIGIPEEIKNAYSCPEVFVTAQVANSVLKSRDPFGHKGSFGSTFVLAGNNYMPGALSLCSRAAIRSGCGKVFAVSEEEACRNAISNTPELIGIFPPELLHKLVADFNGKGAIVAGPGIGQDENTTQLLKLIIQNANLPLLLDADALNILSENKTWLSYLPAGTILTPHPLEFDRLTEKHNDTYSRIQSAIELASRFNLYIHLKGKYSATISPLKNIYYNSTGNNGMATAGSGDVLSGIIGSLLAQGYSSLEACLLGSYLHGSAGDLALKRQSPESLIASDLIEHLGEAFKQLHLFGSQAE